MAYTPTVWADSPSTSTPVNATNLNKLENGVQAAAATADAAAPLASPAFTGNPTAPTASPGDNDTSIATTAFVAAAIVAAVAGLLDLRSASYDASGNAFPSSGGSGSAGAILKGDVWIIGVAGTLGGSAVTPGDLLVAEIDTPGSTAANWSIFENNLTFTPENVANKDADGTMAANSSTKYPAQSAVVTYVATATSTIAANNQTGTTYTLVLTDAGKVVECNNASAVTLTIPPNSSVAFPVGTAIEVFQQGAGQVTLAAGAGVTIRAPGGRSKLFGQYSSASLRKRATDEWCIEGDIST